MKPPLLLLMIGLALAAGCGKDDDDPPPMPAAQAGTGQDIPPTPASNVNGVWNGRLSHGGQSLPATITLQQEGNAVAGTWSSTGFEGALLGTVTGNTVQFTLMRDGPTPCTGSVTVEASVSGDTLTVDVPAVDSSFNIVPSSGSACTNFVRGGGTFTRVTTNSAVGLRSSF